MYWCDALRPMLQLPSIYLSCCRVFIFVCCIIIVVLHILFLHVYAMIMLSALLCVCFLHHAHFTCYVALCLLSLYCIVPSLFVCHVHLTLLYVICFDMPLFIYCIMIIMWVAFFILVYCCVCISPCCLFSQAMPMYHHLLPSDSFHFCYCHFLSSINVHSFPKNHVHCLHPLCQFSAHLKMFWLGSKMAQVWIWFKLELFLYP